MSDDVLAEQMRYYRERAGEYDETSYGDVASAGERIEGLVAQMHVGGSVLEIACGTGMWTGALARRADTLVALDAAPEAIDLARARVDEQVVTFEVADVFSWTSPTRFDVIFFSAWLSHVPSARFEEFWDLLRRLLGDGGRVLFIDEHVVKRDHESYLGDGEIVQRRLRDGTAFRVVKNFIDPAQLIERLRALQWQCEVRRDGADWVIGEARPTS